MCMALFLATDEPAPLVRWDPASPGFHIAELTEREEPVRGRFSKPHVRFVGAHTRCSCGYRLLNLQPDGGHLPMEYAVVEEPEKSAADHCALAAYLRERLAEQESVELYACWDGDWAEQAVARQEATPSEIGDDDFFFLERVFYRMAHHDVVAS